MARLSVLSGTTLLGWVGGVAGLLMATPSGALVLSDSEAGVALVSSSSGTEGIREGNRYRIKDPRTVFRVPEDRQVTVAFEWEGQPGEVRFEGRWRDPTGQVVLVSPIDYEIVKPRFDLYWTLGLSATPTPGLWALEVWVEGQRVGSHPFEVQVPTPERLTPAEVYREGMAAVATVTSLGARGEPLGQGVATALDDGHLLTSFSVIEGATRLKVQLPDGHALETDVVGGWSRSEGWAVLRAPGHRLKVLERSDGAELAIGSQVYVMGSMDDGSLIIIEPRVVGLRGLPTGKEALRLSEGAACGSPVLDGIGRFAGVVIGESAPMLGPMATHMGQGSFVGVPGLSHGDSMLPLSALSDAAGAPPSTLAGLAAAGHFPRPISPASRHVISGVFAARVGRQGGVWDPRFSRRVRRSPSVKPLNSSWHAGFSSVRTAAWKACVTSRERDPE